MKEIKIQNSTYKFIVDDEDYERTALEKWYLEWFNGKPIRIHNPNFKLARFILNYNGHNEIDHKDRNIFNNSKANLREATKQQQSANREKQDGIYHSNYKGVTWHKQRKCWFAYICVRNPSTKKTKMISLGFYDIEENAAQAYNKAAVKYFGEFACLNTFSKSEAFSND